MGMVGGLSVEDYLQLWVISGGSMQDLLRCCKDGESGADRLCFSWKTGSLAGDDFLMSLFERVLRKGLQEMVQRCSAPVGNLNALHDRSRSEFRVQWLILSITRMSVYRSN